MATLNFSFRGKKIDIQCSKDEKMKDICQRFSTKMGKKMEDLYFIYGGDRINEDLTFLQHANNDDKERFIMNIVVNEIEKQDENKHLIKSKEVICPKCNEHIFININDYRINLHNCKNNHFINNILLNKFEDTQLIDISKIVCNNCNQSNKSISYNNEFYKCLPCGYNLCPLCKSTHDKNHKIIKYEEKDYVCDKHYETFTKYCNLCKQNLCIKCEAEHKGHISIYFGDILFNEEEMTNKIEELRQNINILNENINLII